MLLPDLTMASFLRFFSIWSESVDEFTAEPLASSLLLRLTEPDLEKLVSRLSLDDRGVLHLVVGSDRIKQNSSGLSMKLAKLNETSKIVYVYMSACHFRTAIVIQNFHPQGKFRKWLQHYHCYQVLVAWQKNVQLLNHLCIATLLHCP